MYGNDVKAPVGYPYLIKIDPRINTMASFWIEIVKQFGSEELVNTLQGIEKDYNNWKTMREKEKEEKNAKTEESKITQATKEQT